MKKNMGMFDRVFRILIAVAVIILYFTNVISDTLAGVLLAIAGIFIFFHSKDPKEYLIKSIAEVKSKHYDKVLELIKNAIKLDSNYPETYWIRLQIYYLQGKDSSTPMMAFATSASARRMLQKSASETK